MSHSEHFQAPCENASSGAALPARVVKLVDTRDLKSLDLNRSCRFESGPGHHSPLRRVGGHRKARADEALAPRSP
jgi:hypothetical protein